LEHGVLLLVVVQLAKFP